MVRARHNIAVAVVLVASLSFAGCSEWHDLRFTQDRSVTIISPPNLSTQKMPMTLEWTVKPGSEAAKHLAEGAKFVVFMDRYPMAPGADLRSIANEEKGCRGNDACLTEDALFTRFGVTVTDKTSIDYKYFPLPAQGDSRYLTIVLVDSKGKRIGDSVWYTGFQEAKR